MIICMKWNFKVDIKGFCIWKHFYSYTKVLQEDKILNIWTLQNKILNIWTLQNKIKMY